MFCSKDFQQDLVLHAASLLWAQQEPHTFKLASFFFVDLSFEFSRPAVLLYYPHITHLSHLPPFLPLSSPWLTVHAELLPASKSKPQWQRMADPTEDTLDWTAEAKSAKLVPARCPPASSPHVGGNSQGATPPQAS